MGIGSAFEPLTTAREWNSGSCDVMAVALHRRYGLPLVAEFEWGLEGEREVLGYLVHAWVELPDGRMLDAAGPAEAWVQSEGCDANDPWVMGYRVVTIADDDPHLLDIREETDYVDSIEVTGAVAFIESNLAEVLAGLGVYPVEASRSSIRVS